MKNLIEITGEIIKFSHEGRITSPPSEHWSNLNHLFYQFLNDSTVKEINDAIKLDSDLDLPFHIACDLYQRRIYLEDSNPTYLLQFSSFLRLNSNSWTYLADYFDKVASRLQKFSQS